jgi:hypothetical protein
VYTDNGDGDAWIMPYAAVKAVFAGEFTAEENSDERISGDRWRGHIYKDNDKEHVLQVETARLNVRKYYNAFDLLRKERKPRPNN